jgi:hypothetical protein
MAKSTLQLARARPEDLSDPLTLEISNAERRALAALVKKHAEHEIFVEKARELTMKLWLRTTGIALPAAVTFVMPSGRTLALVVREPRVYQGSDGTWRLQACGWNIRQTGATGRNHEHAILHEGKPFRAARRTLMGEWNPVTAPV